jgi:hypothetical protein
MLSKQELDQLVGQFPKNATIEREELTVIVKAPNGEKVLSAAQYAADRWHVMATPGLIKTKINGVDQ